MIRYLIVIVLLLLAGCSTQKDTIKKQGSTTVISREELKKRAMEHFVNGSIAETKGNYDAAVIEYEDALNYDTSSGIFYALAKNYYNLNKFSLALQNAKNAIMFSPDVTDYYSLLADIFTKSHQFDSAAVVYEKIIGLDSSDVNSYYRLAQIYENSKPLKAIGIYNKLTELIGPEWSVQLRLADLNEKMGNIDAAIENIEQCLTIDPGNLSLRKLLIELFEREKRYDEALAEVNDILELMPDELDARERKAQILIEQGKWDEASKEYNYILEKPNIPLEAKIRVGAIYFTRSLQDSSLLPVAKDFFQNIDKDTTDWQVKMYLGAIAINEKNDSLAIDYFREVTNLASWNPEGWIRLGGLYFDNQKYSEAAMVMKEAIKSFPEEFAINLIYGLSLAQQDKHAEAKDYLLKATQKNGNDVTALSAYAFTLNQLKESEEAVKYLKKALSIQPNDVNLLGTLGLIYDAQEKWEECDSVYQLALTIDSANALVNNNYAYSLSERGIELEKALNMINIAIKAEPYNSSYLDTMGWVLFKMGEYEKAKEYLEKAISVGGERAVMLEHLGDVVFKMGQKSQAMEFWEKAFNIDSSNQKLKEKLEKGEI